MDDVTFAHNWPYGGMPIPLQQVTSLRRRVQANVPDASYYQSSIADTDSKNYKIFNNDAARFRYAWRPWTA